MSEAAHETTEGRRIDDALRRALDEVIAPLLRHDGAGLTFVARRDAVLELRAEGSLRGCPGRAWVLREVVLPALQRVHPSLEDLRVV